MGGIMLHAQWGQEAYGRHLDNLGIKGGRG